MSDLDLGRVNRADTSNQTLIEEQPSKAEGETQARRREGSGTPAGSSDPGLSNGAAARPEFCVLCGWMLAGETHDTDSGAVCGVCCVECAA